MDELAFKATDERRWVGAGPGGLLGRGGEGAGDHTQGEGNPGEKVDAAGGRDRRHSLYRMMARGRRRTYPMTRSTGASVIEPCPSR